MTRKMIHQNAPKLASFCIVIRNNMTVKYLFGEAVVPSCIQIEANRGLNWFSGQQITLPGKLP